MYITRTCIVHVFYFMLYLSLSCALSFSFPQDPSSNVRLKLCSLLSQLKTIILLPTDREKQQAFESTISTLLMDKDAETIAAVSCAVKEMAKINYRIQSVSVFWFNF